MSSQTFGGARLRKDLVRRAKAGAPSFFEEPRRTAAESFANLYHGSDYATPASSDF
jgi:hypothetical protein